ncbi:diguanylate cyclase domain-containing protein [Rhodanobacter aciditrophus]|uniref:diguanylate cyclase domain-containing protein n=1 Tax=Rhodanobacter aciditrophus TaxID=1623218 RepID=UPI003CF34D97
MNDTRPKLLIVDDTRANLVAMRRLLGDCGAELVEATSGNDALALCLEHAFALILLDVNMPDMDGFEVATLLGESEHLRDTPIIFVTAAYADDLNRLKGYRSGAVDYIAKPVNDVILRSKVRVFLDLYNARMQLQQALGDLSERNRQLQEEIAVRQRVEAQVRHQATHDMLTGLPNRALFHERLRDAIAQPAAHGHGFALAMLDIDGFKAVNDTHGHPVGDTLLKAIADRLRGRVRAGDTVARLGGDEFALLLEDATELPLLLERCQQLCDTLALPYPLSGPSGEVVAQVSASIGIAVWRPDTASDEALIQAADRALYQAKRAGKNRCMLEMAAAA